MNESDQWNEQRNYQMPPGPDSRDGMQQPWPGYGMPPGYPHQSQYPVRRKRKWIAGLLAFFIPGIGHFYLGLMVKGIVIMLLIALDITAIVSVATGGADALPIVLLSLLLPIIYFYNLFDAIQSTDTVNERFAAAGWNPQSGWTAAPPPAQNGPAAGPNDSRAAWNGVRGLPPSSLLFLGAAAIVVLIMADISWTHWLFNSSGSLVGAVLLIVAGAGLWLWEMRGHSGSK